MWYGCKSDLQCRVFDILQWQGVATKVLSKRQVRPLMLAASVLFDSRQAMVFTIGNQEKPCSEAVRSHDARFPLGEFT